jgi:hypothetical protein
MGAWKPRMERAARAALLSALDRDSFAAALPTHVFGSMLSGVVGEGGAQQLPTSREERLAIMQHLQCGRIERGDIPEASQEVFVSAVVRAALPFRDRLEVCCHLLAENFDILDELGNTVG